jgi:hypothetical protein
MEADGQEPSYPFPVFMRLRTIPFLTWMRANCSARASPLNIKAVEAEYTFRCCRNISLLSWSESRLYTTHWYRKYFFMFILCDGILKVTSKAESSLCRRQFYRRAVTDRTCGHLRQKNPTLSHFLGLGSTCREKGVLVHFSEGVE